MLICHRLSAASCCTRWANHVRPWQFYRTHCTYSYESQCWSTMQTWNKSILALITLTALKGQGNIVWCFIYIVNSEWSLYWCKPYSNTLFSAYNKMKPVTHMNEKYISLTFSFNLNLSSLLTDIIACALLYGLLMYWQDEKSPFTRCHWLPDEVSSHKFLSPTTNQQQHTSFQRPSNRMSHLPLQISVRIWWLHTLLNWHAGPRQYFPVHLTRHNRNRVNWPGVKQPHITST